MKRVELLSPAGGYETMVGAFNAGADAVYLGGSKFGARAYADNFDRDQVLDAVSYAHLHGKKIYMTVNTLVKESEFSQLYDFMLPYAENNLDGVIVQDYGVMRLIRREFPGIELHASTQQAVTGVYSARLLKDRGFTRVVPARELSLSEMRAIREEADIEVEAFIHGAMCYCYSGMCLFSSIVGGRSGNRGRCAQPCRLPYRVKGAGGEEIYPLSLKDMSTISIIPDLIKAGIDSFKIEGRMKKPEYSAGVTALYRKYIDRYYADPGHWSGISEEDLDKLKSLYQRTGISQGYYFRHNDRSMVTIGSPAYNATSDAVLKDVHDRYLDGTLKLKVRIDAYVKAGEPISIVMSMSFAGQELSVCSTGNIVQAASKRPMDEDSISRQLGKLGGTDFEADPIEVFIDDNGTGSGVFVAVSELNDLRRELVNLMLEEIKKTGQMSTSTQTAAPARVHEFKDYDYYAKDRTGVAKLSVLVSSKDQLAAVLERIGGGSNLHNLYLDSNLFLSLDEKLIRKISDAKQEGHIRAALVALPYITRSEEFDGVKEVQTVADRIEEADFDGVLVRNLEQLGYLRSISYKKMVISDYSVYTWNSEAALELMDLNEGRGGFMLEELTIPYELSFREAGDMVRALRKKSAIPVSYNIYGHIPMMVSAGCVKKTTDKCSGKLHELYSENMSITDRMNNRLPVTMNCRSCYNVIWNAHPTSLHNKLDEITREDIFDSYRADFTVEDGRRTAAILDYYHSRLEGRSCEDIFEKIRFTTGHFKRGVE
jgi:putative protease